QIQFIRSTTVRHVSRRQPTLPLRFADQTLSSSPVPGWRADRADSSRFAAFAAQRTIPLPRTAVMKRIASSLMLCGWCLCQSLGCAHMVESKAIAAFAESMQGADLDGLRTQSSDTFRSTVL